KVPAAGLLSDPYAAARRTQIDSLRADNSIPPGDPWKFEPSAHRGSPPHVERLVQRALRPPARSPAAPVASGSQTPSPDTTNINVADAKGNLFSASPSSGWFFGGV